MVDDTEGHEEDSISSKMTFPSDTEGSGDELERDSLLEDSVKPLRVRFRPRVRITSGLNRHRRRRHAIENHQDYLTSNSSSTFSGSPSSSISAPLRTRLDDEVGRPGWGTLGQRVALFSKHQYPGKTTRQHTEGGLMAMGSFGTERTPLLKPSLHFLLSRDPRFPYTSDEEELSRFTDRTFGPWPTRLLNHHVRHLAV